MKVSGKAYLIDTNIIIDYFSNDPVLRERLLSVTTKLLVPSIVIGELFFGAYASPKSKSKIKQINEFIKTCEIIYVDFDTAKNYGKVKSQLKLSGNLIPENDVWIAALSIQHDATVITRDRHFEKPERISVEFW